VCLLKSETKLSKITVRSGTRQNPTFVINLTKVGSTLSPEERQVLELQLTRLSRNTQNRRIPEFVNQNLQDFDVIFGSARDRSQGGRARLRVQCPASDFQRSLAETPDSSRG
jgi:hypothetical protein